LRAEAALAMLGTGGAVLYGAALILALRVLGVRLRRA